MGNGQEKDGKHQFEMAETLDHRSLIQQITDENIEAGRQAQYLHKYAFSPVYTNTDVEYFPWGGEIRAAGEELEKPGTISSWNTSLSKKG